MAETNEYGMTATRDRGADFCLECRGSWSEAAASLDAVRQEWNQKMTELIELLDNLARLSLRDADSPAAWAAYTNAKCEVQRLLDT